jgi:hypothetical protein
MAFATWLLVLLGAGLMYVSFDAQYQFILTQKDDRAASLIEAAMLDAGMVILSALGIGLVRAGKPSRSVRFLIVTCAGASASMNLAAADPASWRSVAAYAAAPVFLAVITDRAIAVIRQHVLPLDTESAWAPAGRAAAAGLRLATVMALYLLRTMLAPASTLRGLRQMVLDATPIPGMTGPRRTGDEPLPRPGCDHQMQEYGSGRPAEDKAGDRDGDCGTGQPVIGFGTKKAAFLSFYRAHAEYGNRSAAGRVAAELAPLAGLQAGTGRTYIVMELRKLTDLTGARSPAEENDDHAQAEPSPQALGESLAALAVQVAALRGQVTLLNQRLDRAGLRGDLDLAARFEELAQTVAGALDAAAPRGPAAPCWIGLDRQAYAAQLGELRQWADTVLRRHYGGYELRDCWPSHIHVIWELSTLAAAWHHAYGGSHPDLGRALEFYDRWLPGTMRRIDGITRACVRECVTRRHTW